MILLIDNYDSFTYNLYQLIGTINPDIKTVRNDALDIPDIIKLSPSHIIISPGPGRPLDAGICEKVIAELGKSVPILGVCLGHQAICEVFGGVVDYAKALMHGKSSDITLDTTCPIFRGMTEHIQGARYHSLAAVEETLPECLKVTARADDGSIMGVKHNEYEIYGVQFHPESILTPDGVYILKNYLNI